jgi:hypothetical protein
MDTVESRCGSWNKGKLLGPKPPLKPKEIWAIRIRLQLAHRLRDLALFNLAIDSKLRGCDLVGLRVHDVVRGSRVASRAIVMQKKTQRPVQFEITEQTRDAVSAWIAGAGLKPEQFLFPGRVLRNAFHAFFNSRLRKARLSLRSRNQAPETVHDFAGPSVAREQAVETSFSTTCSPRLGVAAPHDPAVRADRRMLGGLHRAGPGRLRYALHAPDQADADLPAHPEPAGRAAAARAHQARKHGSVSRHRGR